jgi:uncharacterized delta-60 repeat protein
MVTLGLSGCGGFGSGDETAPPPTTTTPDGGTPTPDAGIDPVGGQAALGITLTVGDAGKQSFVMQTKTAAVPVKLVRRSGSVGPVTITVSKLPKDATADPLTIPAGALDGTLTLHAASTTPQGLSSLDVLATESVPNGASASATLDAFVRGLPGTLDTTFADGGVFKTVFASATSSASDAHILKNGSIVVSGHRTNTFALARFTEAGVLDTTFAGGLGRANIGSGQGDVFLDVHEGATPADGFVSALAFGTITPRVFRTKLDGINDIAFNGTGEASVTLGLGNANGIQTIALPDGSALVLSRHLGTSKAGVVSRWLANGTLDTSYGTSGTCQLTGSGTGSEVNGVSGMFLQPNGSVRVVLSLASGSGAIKACTATGAPDSSIGGAAPDYFRLAPPSAYAAPYFDGGMVFLGASSWGRINAAFIGDTGIGSFGSVATTPEIASPTSMVTQADGGVLVAGTGSTQGTFAVLRFLKNGTRDPDFAVAGLATITVATNGATLTKVVAQPDGRLLLLGRQDDNFDGVIARIWP